jgi:hypothetical protein
VSPVKYKLGFYIPEDILFGGEVRIMHSHSCVYSSWKLVHVVNGEGSGNSSDDKGA